MYKISTELSMPITEDILPINKNLYTLRHNSQFLRRLLKADYHETESILNSGPKIQNLVPNCLKKIV